MRKETSILLSLGCILFSVIENSVSADTVCLKAQIKSGKVTLAKKVVTTAKCPKGYLGIVGSSTPGIQGAQGPTGAAGATGETGLQGLAGGTGATGPTGAAGSDGADGSLRIYGDGSAGPLNVGSTMSLPVTNPQYTDITIAAGQTLSVASGTVLRCTGTFTINGTLQVSTAGSFGSSETSDTATTGTPAIRVPGYGVALGPAGTGEYGSNATALYGGGPAPGLAGAQAVFIRYPVPGSCGSGAGGGATGGSGGSSGGAVVVLCQNNIVINVGGSVLANAGNGFNGSGGGSGGVIILASKSNITNSGNVTAAGGPGGNSFTRGGAGGGGAGGIIHMLAPTVFSSGTRTAPGGAAGLTSVAVTSNPRFGGGAGGSCGGQGGFGANVAAGNAQSGVTAGAAGLVLTTTADPTSLF